jgi:hypothetical protein
MVLACANYDRQQGRHISEADMKELKKAAATIKLDRESSRAQ